MMGKVTPPGARMKKIVCGLVIALMICFVFYKALLYLMFFADIHPKCVRSTLRVTGREAFFQDPGKEHDVTNLEKGVWVAGNVTQQQLFCDGAILVTLLLLYASCRRKRLADD